MSVIVIILWAPKEAQKFTTLLKTTVLSRKVVLYTVAFAIFCNTLYVNCSVPDAFRPLFIIYIYIYFSQTSTIFRFCVLLCSQTVRLVIFSCKQFCCYVRRAIISVKIKQCFLVLATVLLVQCFVCLNFLNISYHWENSSLAAQY